MYPEDRVLVGVMPEPSDLELAHERHWYRIPASQAPNGIHAEYVAFYFTGKFNPDLRWAIHFYARRTGHEFVRRVDLFPDAPDHPRANDHYYMLQLAPLKEKSPPIVSRRWRRITFIQTTWDRFVKAQEVNDLFSSDDIYVDRAYRALRTSGIYVERQMQVGSGKKTYTVDLLIPCRNGAVMVNSLREQSPPGALLLHRDDERNINEINSAIQQQGGPLMTDVPI